MGNKKLEIRNKLLIPAGVERYLSFMAQKEVDVSRIIKSEHNNKSVTSDFFQEHFFASLTHYSLPITNVDFEKMFMWADVRSWLVDESLVRTDKMTMAWGLEQRVPILDHRLVELSLKIPTRWKLSLSGHNHKAIFKEAMRSYLPDHVLHQPKRGWSSPASEWLRRELKDLAYEALSPGFNDGTRDLFNFTEVKGMLEAHINKEAYHMNLLWALLHFQLWYRQFHLSA